MRITDLYIKFLSCSGVSIDTRAIRSGDLFVALKGPNFDANLMAAEALEKGASYAIVDSAAVVLDERYLLVDDALSTLQELARYHRDQMTIPVIAITGSNGKTTTKELMQAVLSAKYKVSATKGNYNNHIGVPLTILNTEPDAELLIVEMGTNQPGDIRELCEMADPDYGIITNIGLAHLEKLLSQEGIYHEKTVLFDHVDAKGGRLFINRDDPWLTKWNGNKAGITDYQANVVGTEHLKSVMSGSFHLELHIGGEGDDRFVTKTNLSGAYNTINMVAALTIGLHFGIPLSDGLVQIAEYAPQNHRSQVIMTDRNTIIADAYNANPSSMKASIISLSESDTNENKLLILGDMLELGAESDRYHKEIVALADSYDAEVIYVGDVFGQYCGDATYYNTVVALIDAQVLEDVSGCTILVKGSRGIRLEQVFDHL